MTRACDLSSRITRFDATQLGRAPKKNTNQEIRVDEVQARGRLGALFPPFRLHLRFETTSSNLVLQPNGFM